MTVSLQSRRRGLVDAHFAKQSYAATQAKKLGKVSHRPMTDFGGPAMLTLSMMLAGAVAMHVKGFGCQSRAEAAHDGLQRKIQLMVGAVELF